MDPADNETASGDAAAQEWREREELATGGGGDASAAAEECPATAGDDDGEGDDSASGDAATYDRMMQLLYGGQPRAAPSEESGDKGSHRFWGTQPVLDINETIETPGPIDDPKTPADVRQEPYKLPKAFEWVSVNVENEDELRAVYDLLTENYVEDDQAMFRFNYKIEFLRWALTPPGFHEDWHVGVRNKKSGALVGFISGIPVRVQVYDTMMTMCEINFLCVHKDLRAKRLAPVLIKEVTRRVNLRDIWQAIYTAGVLLPRPVAACRYWHRTLNPKKLVDVQFTRLGPRMTMSRYVRLNRLPEHPQIPGVRPCTEADVPVACRLLNDYLVRFKLRMQFNDDEFAHWLLPRPGVVDSFVVEDPSTKEVTDFFSFYHLPSTVINHPKHSEIRAAYAFYYAPTKHSLRDIMKDALILAKAGGADVFNALALMDNKDIFEELKFGPGDGELHFYLYNWGCPTMEDKEVGMVLL